MVWQKPPRKGVLLAIIRNDVKHPLALFLWTSGISLVLGSLYRLIWLGGDPQRYIPLLLLGAFILRVMIPAFASLLNMLKYGIIHSFVIDNKAIENSEKLHGDRLYIIPSESDMQGFATQKIMVEANIIRELKYTYQYARIELLVGVCLKHGAIVDHWVFAYRGIE
ncbi:MAG: hypothetical protein AAFX78_11960 [Cyanobacteria bacterium J06638_20]